MTQVISENYLTTKADFEESEYDPIPTLAFSKHAKGHGIAAFNANDSYDHGWHSGTNVPKGNHVVYCAHAAPDGRSSDKEDLDQQYHAFGGHPGTIRKTAEEAANDLRNLGLKAPSKVHLDKLKAKAKESNTENYGPGSKRSNNEKNESVDNLITNLLSGDLVESGTSFKSVLADKIAEKITESKVAIARGLFLDEARKSAQPEEERHEEVDDEEFAKHPVRQLKAIGDWKENTPEESFEYNADGSIDKRSLDAYNKRKAGLLNAHRETGRSQGIASSLPTFKHKNGEQSHISPEHANAIVHIITHPDLDTPTKQHLTDDLHKSAASFAATKKMLGVGHS